MNNNGSNNFIETNVVSFMYSTDILKDYARLLHVFFWEKRRRKRGRPEATRAEGIRGLMGEKGLMEEDWKDRDSWKKKIR